MQGAQLIPKILRKCRSFGLALLISACTTTGPVSTLQEDSNYEIVPPPQEFTSPLDAIEEARRQTEKSEIRIKGRKTYSRDEWLRFASWAQAWDELEAEQDRLEQELTETGGIELIPGQSYSFDLESYCVHGGVARPVTGDELKSAPLRGPAETWLPKILNDQGHLRLPQEKVQYLIWALLYDVRFDELSVENQNLLLRFYPDAAIRFGNRRVEELGKSVLFGVLPSEITGAMEQLASFRDQILYLRDDFRALESKLAPISGRTKPIPVGWMRMPDGFLMRLTSDSYTRVRVDIHVPEEEEGPRRSPQALKWVSLTKWIGLPTEGQRVAISNRTIGRENRYEGTTCEEIQKWHPKKCTSMTEAIRRTLIAATHPENFKNSRYKSPPREGTKIEEEVDCSSFVNEVFRRAGIEYPYTPTANMRCLKTFSEVPQSDAKTGDLILYQGHVGILDDDGLVISATVGGPGRRSMRLPTDPGFLSAITRLKRDQVHAGKWVILRWRCT
jgi:hypothetical protein